jgi:hypothetical protein
VTLFFFSPATSTPPGYYYTAKEFKEFKLPPYSG